MKKSIRLVLSPVVMGAALLCVTSSANAQQRAAPAQVQPTQPNAAPAAAENNRGQIGRLDDVTTGPTIRASQLIGMNIENPQGEGLGEVNDLVIDGKTGRIRYAAVTYGGFLGLGDKMFAVPFEAFQVRAQRDDPDDYVLMLNVTQQQLEGAQGFDQDHWPNFADRNFTNELDRRYGIDRQRLRQRAGQRDVDVDIRRNGVDVDVDRRDRR